MEHLKFTRNWARAAMLLLTMLCCLTGARADEVEIGDGGTTNNSYLPGYNFYNYSYTQQIYTAGEIGTAGTIKSIAFKNTGAEKTRTYSVYMTLTDKESFASNNDWVPMNDEKDLVFEGELTFAVGEWTTIELDAPFSYDGSSNLLVAVADKTGNYTNSPHMACLVFSASNQALYKYQDGNAIDIASPPQGQLATVKNQIILDITLEGGSICDKPSTLTVSDVTGYGAAFAWESEVGNYTFEYKKSADSEWTVVTGLTTNTYTLSNLEPFTAYSARVKAVCGVGSESGYRPANFTTSEVCPDGKVCIGSGTATNNYLPTYTYYNYSLTQQIYTADEIGEESAILSVDFYSNAATTRTFDIYMVSTDKESFTEATDWVTVTNADLVFSGSVSFTANEWTTIVLDNPFIYNGKSNVVLVIDDNTGTYVSSPGFFAFDAEGQGIRVYSDDTNYDPLNPSSYSGTVMNVKNRVRLGIGEPPAVLKPTGLTVNYTEGVTATVSWTSDESAFELDVNGTVIENITTKTYELTNLELATTYEVKVRAKKDNEYSDWTSPVSFTTERCMPEDKCSLTFEVSDSYGDGWNGASIDVYEYDSTEGTVGELLGSVTCTNEAGAGETQTYTLSFCDGQELAIIWTEGSYDSEASYTVTDINGDAIVEGEGEGFDGFAYTMNCTVSDCRKPTDFAATEVGPHNVVLSWTENGQATEWVIEYISAEDTETTTITVDENPYTLSGLTPETMYAAQVTPVCDEEKPSKIIYFTTTEATPAPTALAATPSPTTAELSWKGFAEAYTLEYAEVPETKSGDGWLYYDNGTPQGNSGIGTGSETDVYWAVMFTPDMLDGNGQLSKVSVYESSGYNTEPITIYVYSDGDTAPGTLLYEETVNPESANAFHEITLTTPVLFDATKNLWIVIKENGTYPAMGSTNTGDPNGRWISLDGSEWNDVTGYSLDYTWMIRGYFESGIDTSTLTWITVSGVNPPYTIEGLKPETKYMVRVKGLYGDEGESAWTSTTFTTPSECDAPIDPETADITTTSSTLKWTGYQESYNLYYRKSLPVDPSTPATIILTAHDVWGDGSGYQMLIDANANAYGSIIPTTGALTSGGDVSDETYGEFEYKIPTNADGALTTENIVFDGSVTIEIPAGSYDWCITNPTDGDRMWIAGTNGNVPGRYDDFVFEPGVTYEFAVSKIGSGDGVTLTITRDMSDWTLVEDITNPYELTDLTPGTIYEWQVQGISESCGGTTEWSEIASFTTLQSLELADDESNIDLIKNNHGKKADVTLSGRTLWKDGTWNTLVLPFNYDLTADGSVLEGADVRSLSGASYSGNKLKLNFTSEGDVEEIEAGKPYIIRWKTASNTNLESPVFSGVTIDKTTANTVADLGDEKTLVFQGIYFPLSFGTEETSVLFLGADSKLYWPLPGAYVGAQRAIFSLSGFSADDAAGVRFVLDFGEDGGTTTGIISVNDGKTVETGDWYDLNGRKLDNMPARKGVYIRNGKKEVIK